jgi:hypothetical protein
MFPSLGVKVRNVPGHNQRRLLERAALVHCVIVRLIRLSWCLQMCMSSVYLKETGKFLNGKTEREVSLKFTG